MIKSYYYLWNFFILWVLPSHSGMLFLLSTKYIQYIFFFFYVKITIHGSTYNYYYYYYSWKCGSILPWQPYFFMLFDVNTFKVCLWLILLLQTALEFWDHVKEQMEGWNLLFFFSFRHACVDIWTKDHHSIVEVN